MSVEVHLCRHDEIELVMQFIDEHWAPDHVLSWHRPLMDFQHRAPDHYNFVIARRSADGQILGVLGFISAEVYDDALRDRNTIWLALWKVRADARVAGLGLMLFRHLEATQTFVTIAVSGIGDPALLAIYRTLGFQIGECQQHYLRNWRVPHPRLARFPDEIAPPPPPAGDATLEALAPNPRRLSTLELDLGERADEGPAKSPAYFARRYWEHPVYRYDVHLVRRSQRPVGLLASRVAGHDGSKALRIVDYFGQEAALGQLGGAVDALLDKSGCEYADLWTYGIDADVVARSGFRRVQPAGTVIVPNFFEPYERANGVIRCAFKGPADQRFLFFRADGDQDRPNQIQRPGVVTPSRS